jgi:hypothetical protein
VDPFPNGALAELIHISTWIESVMFPEACVIPPVSIVGVILLVACILDAILFHIFILDDPFSSIINVLLIFAIIAARRNHIPENEDLIIRELRGSQSEGARDGAP